MFIDTVATDVSDVDRLPVSLSGQFTFSPVYKQPTATMPQVFVGARDRKVLALQNPPIVTGAAPASSSKEQEAIKTCT